jgi:hypothetical protein
MWLFVSLKNKELWVMDFVGHVEQLFSIGIGKPETPTPVGVFYISEKVENPQLNYNDVDGNGLVELGCRVLETTISGWDHSHNVMRNYSIHGTNEPELIGTECSKGCIRLKNDDILKLYNQADVGTMVVAWFNDPISYLEEMRKYGYCAIKKTFWNYDYSVHKSIMIDDIERLRKERNASILP